MSKARNTGNLNNSIQISDTGNITFVSGSTTLLAISSSGAVTTTGVISGSNALSASFAATASFVTLSQTASFVANAQSASNAVSAITASSADSFLVRNTLTAQTIVVQTITSSVDFVTGSTQFGSKNTDVHTYTGSLAISGSSIFGLNVNAGALYVSSSGNIGASTTTPNRLLTVNGDSSLFNGTDSTGAISPGASEIITLGFNLAASETRDISNINLTADKWKAIVRGGFANNNEGGGLVSPSLEIEVDSNNATIDVGSTDITFSRNATTSKLQVTNLSATHRVTFVGTIQVLNYAQSALPTVSKIMLNNVGIGTISPSARLHVSSSTAASTVFRVDTAGSTGTLFVSSSGNVGIGTTNPLGRFQAIQNQNGTSAFYFSNATSGTSARSRVIIESDASAGSLSLGMHSSTHASTPNEAWIWGSGASTPLILGTIGSERVRITPGGNVAIGNTGSAWNIGSPVLQMGSSGVHLFGASTQAQFGSNAFYDGTNYKFIVNNWATRFIQNSVGGEMWFERSSASGTAGNNITFNTSMYISNSGSVGIGTTSPEAALEIRKLSQTIPSLYFSGKSSYDGTEAKGLAITHYYSDTGTNRQLAIYNPNYPDYPYIRFVVSNINYAAINAITGSTASLKGLYLNDSLYIASGGSVGIGTTSPTTKLHVVGAIGNGLSTYPHNARLVKTGTTSVTFTINIPYASNWNPGYATVRVAGSRTGLEEQYAAMYFVRLTYYAGSTSSIVYNIAGDTGNATVSVSSSAPSNSVVTITITDGGPTTDYIIADVDACFNGGIISMA